MQTNLECYLWDLAHEGVDEPLDRMRGEIGVSGVVLPVVCPPLRMLRPHAGAAPRSFRTAGGAQFQPDTHAYAGTRLRPPVDGWLRKSNPLKTVVEAARARTLNIAGWIAACESPALIERQPAAAARDAFGDPFPDWLCPVNPDVQEYLRALVSDLVEHYALTCVRVSHLHFPPVIADEPAHGGEQQGFALGEVERHLRAQCFCEACVQLGRRSDIDMTAAAMLVRETLERSLAEGAPTPAAWSEFLAEHPLLADLGRWRSSELARLVFSLAEVAGRPLELTRSGPAGSGGLDPGALFEQAAAGKPARFAGPPAGWVVFAHSLEPGPLASTLARAVEECGDIARVHLRVSAGRSCPDSATLVAGMVQAARSGVGAISVHNYGLLPAARLEWVHQAVRFAQRESR